MILAAGFGTRLQELGLNRPKPLLPVCGVKLIRFALAQLAAAGIRQVVINLHHQAPLIREALGDGAELGMELSYSIEEGRILGTGGGIRKVRDFFGDSTFVVMNGKIVSDLDLGSALKFHLERSAAATMVLHPEPDPYAWGAVEVNEEGFIRRLAGFEGPGADEESESLMPYVFTGIHVLQPEFLNGVGDGPQCIVRTAYRDHLKGAGAGSGIRPVAGYVASGYWQDHSTPARYLKGNFNLLDRTVPLWPGQGLPELNGVDPSARLSPDVELRPPVRICAGAQIGAKAAVGPHVVVGSGARIADGVRLSRCVVWENADVEAGCDSVVVTPGGSVAVDLSDDGARIGPPIKR